jgi:hypothetical protein
MTGVQKNRRIVLLGVMVGLLLAARINAPDQAQARAVQQRKEQHLIDLSVPLFQVIAPNVDRQTLALEYTTPDYLSISSHNAAGDEIASVTWDVHRDTLCEVTGSPSRDADSHNGRLSGQALVWKTHAWLQALGFILEGDRWRPAGSPLRLKQHRWTVNWMGDRQRAIVQIDDRSGGLYLINIRNK